MAQRRKPKSRKQQDQAQYWKTFRDRDSVTNFITYAQHDNSPLENKTYAALDGHYTISTRPYSPLAKVGMIQGQRPREETKAKDDH